MRVGQAVFIHLHPLGQAVAQEPHVRKPAAVHGLRGGLRRQPEIHGRGAVGLGLDAQAAGRCVADGVPLGAGELLLQNGGALHGIRALVAVEALPEHAHGNEQHQQYQQGNSGKHPAPAAVQDAAAVFLIISHKSSPVRVVISSPIIQRPGSRRKP